MMGGPSVSLLPFPRTNHDFHHNNKCLAMAATSGSSQEEELFDKSNWDEDYLDSLEVTHDDYQKQIRGKNKSIIGSRRRLLRGLRQRTSPKKKSPTEPSSHHHHNNNDNASITSSIVGEGVAKGGGGITVASNDDTVLMSNKELKSLLKQNRKKPWKSLKRMITGNNNNSSSNKQLTSVLSDQTMNSESSPSAASPYSVRERSRSEAQVNFKDEEAPQKNRLRFDSAPLLGRKNKKNNEQQQQQQEELLLKREQSNLDDAIRGRLDGMDVLSLGPARSISIPKETNDDMLDEPFSHSLKSTPRGIVRDMMWLSAGQEIPEMVLEGFIPAGDDRWLVRMDLDKPPELPRRPRRKSGKPPKKSKVPRVNQSSSTDSANSNDSSRSSDSWATTFCANVASIVDANFTFQDSSNDVEQSIEKLVGTHADDVFRLTHDDDSDHNDEDEEDVTPLDVLMKSMWGNSPPPPTHMSRTSTTSSTDDGDDEERDVLQMAASCSVPVDIDEDTFLIDTAAHLQSVHDICAEPLKAGHYRDALRIFQKILKGLESREEQEGPRHLIGVTLHNMGIVQMWQGNLEKGLECFEQAVEAREKSLSRNHIDIAVSCMREGIAWFALESFDLAVQSFERALSMTTNNNATRAKVFTNLGVAHYHREDLSAALHNLSSALEIQRLWLAGPVRRSSIVFDVSITLTNIGKVYMEQKEYDAAIKMYEEALLLQTSAFRKDHDIVLVSLGNLAFAKAKSGDYPAAIQTYLGLLRAQETKHGKQSRDAIDTSGLLGVLYAKNGQLTDAMYRFKTVHKWQQAHLKSSNPAIGKTEDVIRQIRSSLQSEAGSSSLWI